nr:MAG TPA: CD24 protein [Bacteriophage sp.]
MKLLVIKLQLTPLVIVFLLSLLHLYHHYVL